MTKDVYHPCKASLYSIFDDEDISDILTTATQVPTVLDCFNFQNMVDYHDSVYLMSAYVLLLARLQACCSSLQACLKMTNVELELLTEPDTYLFI